jgi:iron complex transport system ATP-binding protein
VTALALEDVSVKLGGATVVDRLSTTVGEGEWVALIGPNGAGKTTVLRAVAGLVPHQGAIAVGGTPARQLGRRELARRVAFVRQEPVIPDEMRVRDYVLLGRTPHLGYLGREGVHDVDAAERALVRLDLAAFALRRLATLSGGERRRAVLARALAQEAPVLLLDEPTASLDIGREQGVLELVDELRREYRLTVLAAMHELTLAAQHAHRLLLLEGGRVVAEGAASEVLTEERLADSYGAAVAIVVDERFGLAVVPRRRTQEQRD